MADKDKSKKILNKWIERDLTAEARVGKLEPAFEVEEIVDQLTGALSAGLCPILIGDAGVGKTAVVYELVRRSVDDDAPSPLRGKRVLQFSLQLKASTLGNPHSMMRPQMSALLDALSQLDDDLVLFFRDCHLAYNFDLEPHFQVLADRFPGRILAEGSRDQVNIMFEVTPDLDKKFLTIHLEEPTFEKASKILEAWNQREQERTGITFTAPALEQAMILTHRFLSRSVMPRQAIDLLRQLGALTAEDGRVTDDHVVTRFCRIHRAPRFLIDSSEPLDLDAMFRNFQHQVLGQFEAVKAIVARIGLIKAGLADPRRPFGVFLFAGPTGVGKTHLAQVLAENLFGNRDRLIRLNMADFPDAHAPQTLFGNPQGDVPMERRGLLTTRVEGHPLGILLLDEFEKAHREVLDRFMQLIDEGRFINGAGEAISCRSMIIIATTNAGAEIYRGESFGFTTAAQRQDRRHEVTRRLEENFRFEFLNRFDQVVHFQPLSREHIRTIALRELERLQERSGLRQRRFTIETDESVVDWLVAHGYDPDYGARFLRRTMERDVTTALADLLVRQRLDDGSRISMAVRKNKIAARVVPEIPSAEPQKREVLVLPLGTGEEVRRLDRISLLDEAAKVSSRAKKRLHQLAKKKEDRSLLLERMNKPRFWEGTDEKRRVLDRFRELDVAIRVEERLAGPLLQLAELGQSSPEGREELSQLARLVERGAEALNAWEERVAEEGAGAVWLTISSADPLQSAGSWLRDLAEMELRWCRRLGLDAEVVAFETHEDELIRVVLDVEGPGAAAYLAMEEGIHRRRRREEGNPRVVMESIDQGPPPTEEWPRIAPIRRRKGVFGLDCHLRGSLEIEKRGLVLGFVAGQRAVLSHLLHDLSRAWQAPADEPPALARVYGERGIGAKDPRTGATAPRLKDVLKGNLDRFLEEWRHRSETAQRTRGDVK